MISADVRCAADTRIVACRVREPCPVWCGSMRQPCLCSVLSPAALACAATTPSRCAEAVHSPALAHALSQDASSCSDLAVHGRRRAIAAMVPLAVRDTQQRATGWWRGVSGRAAAAGAGRIAVRRRYRGRPLRAAQRPGAMLCAASANTGANTGANTANTARVCCISALILLLIQCHGVY